MEVLVLELCVTVLVLAGGAVSFIGFSTDRLGTHAAGGGIMLIPVLPIRPILS